jgi:hypothetical protein
MADEVKRLLALPFRPIKCKLTAKSATLDIPCDKPPTIDELRQQAKKSYPAKRLLASIERGEKPPTSKRYQMVTWVFDDDLAMVFLSDEVVVDYALRLKRDFDGSRLWISAYCNDVSTYIVSKRLISEGGYEVRNSLSARVTYGCPEQVKPAMEDRIVGQVRSLLPEIFRSASQNPSDR